MKRFTRFFTVPDYLLSTEEQNRRYIQSTYQAQQYRKLQADNSAHRAERVGDYLPLEPLSVEETNGSRQHSLKRKVAASVLALGVVVAPTGQYAAADREGAGVGVESVDVAEDTDCYVLSESAPDRVTVESFTYSYAGNDALSEPGKAQVAAAFEQSEIYGAIEESFQDMHSRANVKIEVIGLASDDNRQNYNAGIGEEDAINEATARSYASIAANAITKLLKKGSIEAELTQRGEEQVLSVQEQRQLDEIQRATNFSSKTDLLTAYNSFDDALSGSQRSKIDAMIGENRGVEVRISSVTSETHTEHIMCSAATEVSIGSKASQPVMFGKHQAVMPEWFRVRSATTDGRTQGRPRIPSAGSRLRRRIRDAKNSLGHDIGTFKEDMQSIVQGSADMVRDLPNDVHAIRTGRVERAAYRKLYDPRERRSPGSIVLGIVKKAKNQVTEAKKFTHIPTEDLGALTRSDFYKTHKEFPEDVHKAKRRILTRVMRHIP